MQQIVVKDIVGENAISMQSGKLFYDEISKPIFSGHIIEADFEGVNIFASPFFNASVGLLLKDIEISILQERLKIHNLNNVGSNVLNLVISNAIKFYEMDEKEISDINDILKEG